MDLTEEIKLTNSGGLVSLLQHTGLMRLKLTNAITLVDKKEGIRIGNLHCALHTRISSPFSAM